jgi:hypothetical protein
MLPPDDLFDYLFEFKDEEPYNKRFESLEFDSKSFICTMGFMFIIMILTGFSYVWLGIISLFRKIPCLKNNARFNKYVSGLKDKLIWTSAMVFV